MSEKTPAEHWEDQYDDIIDAPVSTERRAEGDKIRSAIGTTLEAWLIDNEDPEPDQAVTQERIRAMASVISWARDNEFEFRLGTPYRKDCRHDNECPTMDWSDIADHVVPIYLFVNGEKFAFVIDVMVHQQGRAGFEAVTMMGGIQADALNRAIGDMEWRMQNLPGLLFDDAHCWIMRVVAQIG